MQEIQTAPTPADRLRQEQRDRARAAQPIPGDASLPEKPSAAKAVAGSLVFGPVGTMSYIRGTLKRRRIMKATQHELNRQMLRQLHEDTGTPLLEALQDWTQLSLSVLFAQDMVGVS